MRTHVLRSMLRYGSICRHSETYALFHCASLYSFFEFFCSHFFSYLFALCVMCIKLVFLSAHPINAYNCIQSRYGTEAGQEVLCYDSPQPQCRRRILVQQEPVLQNNVELEIRYVKFELPNTTPLYVYELRISILSLRESVSPGQVCTSCNS